MEVMEAIKGRRSIRNYTSRPVDDKTLEIILEAARQAPSWANTQCWRFILVRDKKVKDKLIDTLTRLPNRPNPAARAVKETPVTIVACAELRKSGYSFREPKKPVTDKGD